MKHISLKPWLAAVAMTISIVVTTYSCTSLVGCSAGNIHMSANLETLEKEIEEKL